MAVTVLLYGGLPRRRKLTKKSREAAPGFPNDPTLYWLRYRRTPDKRSIGYSPLISILHLRLRTRNGPFSTTMTNFAMILDIPKRAIREVFILFRSLENFVKVDENGQFCVQRRKRKK